MKTPCITLPEMISETTPKKQNKKRANLLRKIELAAGNAAIQSALQTHATRAHAAASLGITTQTIRDRLRK